MAAVADAIGLRVAGPVCRLRVRFLQLGSHEHHHGERGFFTPAVVYVGCEKSSPPAVVAW